MFLIQNFLRKYIQNWRWCKCQNTNRNSIYAAPEVWKGEQYTWPCHI
ncbi:unnamed protein product [Paramecium sonneborni]|uniref:Uncharacterized protein n=1 Tax=Paramecium sonneborni TaxID=65129 RepID=A0A8S1R4E5_9CILI|nr:unnamed protein product [Paramecium sonneborni]